MTTFQSLGCRSIRAINFIHVQFYNSCQTMGQFIEGLPSLSAANPKRSPIDSELFSTSLSTEAGSIVTRLQDGAICFLSHREVQQAAVGGVKEKALNDWLCQNYTHSCNILQYDIRSRSLLCNDQVTLKVLLQYGHRTLHQMLVDSNGSGLDCSAVTRGSEAIRFETPLERMGFVRLMLDMAEEQKNKNKLWVGFHTKSLVYFPREKTFKFFHLLSLDDSAFTESFFAPEEAGQLPSQQSCVFSMGLVLLSLFLGEDCSDCYNYQNFTFCESIFQDKLDRLKQGMITRGLMGILDDQSRYVPQFDEQVSELILLMTAPKEERLCFAEVKRRYLWLIRKASMSYTPSIDPHHTHTRSILQPLTSKRAQRGRTKSKAHPNIGCFSTNEDLHFRTTITEANESDFFALSRSNFNGKRQGKEGREGKGVVRRDSQALQWKKAITNRMKQYKENVPFYQQQ